MLRTFDPSVPPVEAVDPFRRMPERGVIDVLSKEPFELS